MSGPDYLLAIDQGTTSTRAILFDAEGAVRHTARVPLRQIYPRPGWVEHDPEEIWQAVVATCREAIAAAKGHPIAAIGITNQRETTVLWERATGRPLHNAIVWQDRRTAEICESWRAAGLADMVAARTGLVIDPYFSASKISWLLDALPGLRARARAGEVLFGTVDSFLLWRLTGGRLHATDVTNASRTMLFDLRRFAWDDDLLDAFGVPRALLPEARDTDGDFGTTDAGLFGDAIPIAGVVGDQQAALIGQACFRPGMVKSTYGTGAFALIHTGDEPARLAAQSTDDRCLPPRRRDRLRARRLHLHRRRRGAMAARPAARRHRSRRNAGPRRARRPAPARLFRAGLRRAWCALLVARGARRRSWASQRSAGCLRSRGRRSKRSATRRATWSPR